MFMSHLVLNSECDDHNLFQGSLCEHLSVKFITNCFYTVRSELFEVLCIKFLINLFGNLYLGCGFCISEDLSQIFNLRYLESLDSWV